MRTGPLVDALIEHLVGYLGSYALENGFLSSWRALSWHEPTHGRATGRSWVTGGAARPAHPGRRAGPPAPGTTVVLRRPRAPFRQISRTTDRAGLAHRARDDGDGMTERKVRSFHGEAGSPPP